ncbi:MAG: amidohydrolase family protein [Myxococcales bacterium]|nr:amidohydrolase family protein [Myxococcales bacterium]
MADLGYQAFDADNHYYEAEDAFTRHIDPRMAKRTMQWGDIGGKKRLLVGGKINRFIPNPTFDPVSKPGALEDYFRSKASNGGNIVEAFGELDPIHIEYRSRDARLALMKSQGLQGAFFFPTLGVGMEESLKHDVPALLAAFRAFNRWLDEDWGFAYKESIFAAPYITLADPDWAVEELEWALSRDLRLIVMRSGPVITQAGSYRSPGDPIFDPFWARVSEAGITTTYHGGDAGYGRYAADWGESGETESFRHPVLTRLLSPQPVHDTMAALIAQGVFARHKNLRLAAIENGSGWVGTLTTALKKAWVQVPHEFAEDPMETFQRHVWVSPFFEDDLDALKKLVPAERMMMGSDYPHAEGLPNPTDWVREIPNFTKQEQLLVMRENPLSLSVQQSVFHA